MGSGHSRISFKHLLAALPIFVACSAFSNSVTRVTTSVEQPEINKPFKLTFSFSGDPNAVACGMTIDWGDGKTERLRFGEGQQVIQPYAVEHTYATPGQYKLRVYGEALLRGLRSVPACDVKREGTLTAVDPVEVARLAEQKAEQDRIRRERQEEEERVRRERREEEDRIRKARQEEARLQKEKEEQMAAAEQRKKDEQFGKHFRTSFFDKKWSLGSLPCSTNGGAYVIYTNRPPSGDTLILGGKLSQSQQKQVFDFKILDGSTIEYTHIIYAEGNQGVMRFVKDPDTVVARKVSRIRLVSKTRIEYESAITSIDINAMFNGSVRYENKTERSFGVICP